MEHRFDHDWENKLSELRPGIPREGQGTVKNMMKKKGGPIP